MTMRIAFEHVFCRGLHKVKIVKIEVLDKEKLPLQYTENQKETQVFVHKPFGNRVLFVNEADGCGHNKFNNFREGETISLEEKDWILKVMESAGYRLFEVNQRINAEKDLWEGKIEKHEF